MLCCVDFFSRYNLAYMANDYIYEKLNSGELISTNELAFLLLSQMNRLHREAQDDLALFSRITMAEFDKVHAEFENVYSRFNSVETAMATKTDLKEVEERLTNKIEASHSTTNHRIDWLDSKYSKLA